MKKYKNDSGKDVGFIVDGRTLDFQNGQVVECPDNFKENMTKVLDKIMPLESVAAPVSVPVVAPVIAPEVVPKATKTKKKVTK